MTYHEAANLVLAECSTALGKVNEERQLWSNSIRLKNVNFTVYVTKPIKRL